MSQLEIDRIRKRVEEVRAAGFDKVLIDADVHNMYIDHIKSNGILFFGMPFQARLSSRGRIEGYWPRLKLGRLGAIRRP